MHSTLLVAAFAALSAASPLAARSASATSGSPPSSTVGVVANVSPSPGTISKLLSADNTVARFKVLQSEIAAGNAALKFDFNPAANPAVTPGEGGQVDLAQRGNFPLLTGLGLSAAGIFFQPCGLNTPHSHPRASEFLTVVTDSNVFSGFILENGLVSEFNTTLTQYQGTAFPQGSIHFQQNLDCHPTVAIAGLNSEDPGASSIAQNFLVNADGNIVEAAIGFPNQIHGENFAQFKAGIPAPLAKGVEECLIRCHIPY